MVKMELLWNFCLLLASGFSLFATGATGQPECQPWKNVTDVVKRLDPLNVTCGIYQSCTGFECNGIMNLDKVNEDISFAVSLLPCSDPLKFQVFVDIAKYPPFNLTLNISKNQVINNTFPLPALTRNLGPISTEGNLSIVLSSSISPSGKQIVTAEVAVRVKIIGMGILRHFVLIPNVTFPVSECPSQSQPPSPPPVSVSLSSTTGNTTLDFTGVTCSPSSLKNPCGGDSQMCSSDGKCVCSPGYRWNGSAKKCDDSSSSGPATWIIVVAAVCTIIAIAGFVIFLVYKYRRHQDRYGQHALLINNDNDAEFDDADPPMLTG